MIIGIKGNAQAGKDTVGKLINYLLTGAESRYESVEYFLKNNIIIVVTANI